MTTRIHFAAEAFELAPCSYIQALEWKPRGLWYSVEGNEDGWSDWCRYNEFCETDLQIAHAVELDVERVVVIDNGASLLAFQREYCRPHPILAEFDKEYAELVGPDRHGVIDWPLVATRYDGIEIAPYQYAHRMGSLWYNTWDCASGCIWNIDAIRSFDVTDSC